LIIRKAVVEGFLGFPRGHRVLTAGCAPRGEVRQASGPPAHRQAARGAGGIEPDHSRSPARVLIARYFIEKRPNQRMLTGPFWSGWHLNRRRSAHGSVVLAALHHVDDLALNTLLSVSRPTWGARKRSGGFPLLRTTQTFRSLATQRGLGSSLRRTFMSRCRPVRKAPLTCPRFVSVLPRSSKGDGKPFPTQTEVRILKERDAQDGTVGKSRSGRAPL